MCPGGMFYAPSLRTGATPYSRSHRNLLQLRRLHLRAVFVSPGIENPGPLNVRVIGGKLAFRLYAPRSGQYARANRKIGDA